METPNTPAGELTERIMAAITERIGKMPVEQYNATYSAVLHTLEEDRRLDSGTLQAFKAAVDGSKYPNEKTKAIEELRDEEMRNLLDKVKRMEQAIMALLASPGGCRRCDLGKLRTPNKSHDDDCPYLMLESEIVAKPRGLDDGKAVDG